MVCYDGVYMKKLLYSFIGLIGLNEVNSVIHKKQSFSCLVVAGRPWWFI